VRLLCVTVESHHSRKDDPTTRGIDIVPWWLVVAVLVFAVWLWPMGRQLLWAQASEADHESHHPPASGTKNPDDRNGGHGGMMEGMGEPSSKPLYPSLIQLPEISPEQRARIEREAKDRLHGAVTEVSEASQHLERALAHGNEAMVEDAAEQLRRASADLESGIAARRALAAGADSRQVALQWLKETMNLAPVEPVASRPFGVSWFHGFVMLLLVAFSAGMLWTYVARTRRAAELLQTLTGTSTVGEARAADVPREAASTYVPGLNAPPAQSEVAVDLGRRWTGRLRIGRIFDETPDVKTFRLLNPLGGVLPFAHLPGQFLTIAMPSDGKPVRRSYTIASSPAQRDYAEITVKHEKGGLVSEFLHSKAREGDLVDCSGPLGSFIFTGRECRCILLIGGGVGITPLMSVLRFLTDRAWPGDIYLLYGCHSPHDIIFRSELEYLQQRHRNLRVVITVTEPLGTSWAGPTGRITKELIRQSVPDVATRYVHLCGPVAMMETAKQALTELGVPRERIKTEAFGPALGRPEPVTRSSATATLHEGLPSEPLPTVLFASSGKSAPLPPDTAILDVADEIGVEIDNSCRVGTCGLCRVKLLSGIVTMAVEEGLQPSDKEHGIVLACQAKSTGNVAVEA